MTGTHLNNFDLILLTAHSKLDSYVLLALVRVCYYLPVSLVVHRISYLSLVQKGHILVND